MRKRVIAIFCTSLVLTTCIVRVEAKDGQPQAESINVENSQSEVINKTVESGKDGDNFSKLDKILENGNKEELTSYLDSELKEDISYNSNIIRRCIKYDEKNAYLESSYFNSKEIKNKINKELKYNKNFNEKNIKDEELKTYIEKLHREGFKINTDTEIFPVMDYTIYDNYKNKIDSETVKVLEFLQEDSNEPAVNNNTSMIYYDNLLNRILEGESLSKELKNDDNKAILKVKMGDYIKAYVNLNGIESRGYARYQNVPKFHGDSEFLKDAKEYVEIMKADKYVVDDAIVNKRENILQKYVR